MVGRLGIGFDGGNLTGLSYRALRHHIVGQKTFRTIIVRQPTSDFFELHGYQVAYDDSVEPGFRKIAIYVENDEFRHVARQEPNGLWSSKIGPQEDITHELRALESSGLYGYGVASIFMKKS